MGASANRCVWGSERDVMRTIRLRGVDRHLYGQLHHTTFMTPTADEDLVLSCGGAVAAWSQDKPAASARSRMPFEAFGEGGGRNSNLILSKHLDRRIGRGTVAHQLRALALDFDLRRHRRDNLETTGSQSGHIDLARLDVT